MKARVLLGAVVLTIAPAVVAAPRIFVAEEGGDTVSVVDDASFRRVAAIPVGRGPHNVQASPDGRFVWVTNEGDAHAGSHKGMPATEHAATAGRGEVWIIDAARRKVVAKVPVGRHPAHVVLTPDGRHAYVTNGGDDSVTVVDAATHRTVSTIAVGAYPHGIRVSPDGREAWVANLKGGSVSVIDTGSRQEVARLEVGLGPAQTGFSPDGRMAFVSLSQEGAVALVDPAARKVMAKVPVGQVPIQVHATPDNRRLLVAIQGTKDKPGNVLSVVDLETRRVSQSIRTGAGAHGVVVPRNGTRAFVTNTYANTVSVVDLEAGRTLSSVRVGRAPNGISVID